MGSEMPEIERKYNLECAEYDSVIFGVSDEFAASAKLEQEQLAKLADVGGLQPQLDNGTYVAIEAVAKVTEADVLTKSLEDFEANRDKAVDAVMATKLPALDKKK